MDQKDVEVAIVGAGAAGIAAARRLADAGRDVLLIEARERIGGRSFTIHDPVGGALDLGCGWLHSGDVNPWTTIAEATGRTVDRTPPPWSRRTLEVGFPLESQQDFQAANEAFHARLDAAASDEADRPASELLAPGDPWNGLIGALSTYISGAELASVGVRDLTAYADTGVNWRVEGGYGALIASHAAGVPVLLGSPAKKIEHGGERIRIETASTLVTAEHAVVTLPSALVADEAVAFEPALPEKVEAARRLPLGLADKIYLALDDAEEFAPDARIFGRTDSVATAAYHFRAGGRPIVEGYFGGALARGLEGGGIAAFFDHAHAELTNVFGKAFGERIRPLAMHCWASDPFARGSYSYAVPGGAPARAVLAASVGRLHFAGEACSEHDFSTAHGAYRTGLAAAEKIIGGR